MGHHRLESVRNEADAIGDERMSSAHELVARFLMLGPDHRAVFDLLLDKAEGGQRKYGILEIESDRRDFEAEARAEMLDCIHYLGAECVRLKRERDELRELGNMQRAEIETLRNRLSVAQRLVPR